MPIATVKQLCTPSAAVTSDSLVEQVEQIEALASGQIDGREFFRRNFFTAGLDLLVRRGFDRLAGRSEDGAFYLTQAMGGGKTHSLIALGLLASEPGLRREVVPKVASGTGFAAARVVVFSGHQNPERLLWGHIADQLGCGDVMAPFWRNGAKTPGIDEWLKVLGPEPVLILLDELPSYLQMAQGEPVGQTTLRDLVDYAAQVANGLLVPEGFPPAMWRDLGAAERYYARMLDVEAKGSAKVADFQNFAKSFAFGGYADLMASAAANAASLAGAADLKGEMLSGEGFGGTQLRQVLFAVWKTMEGAEPDPKRGVTILKSEYAADYWQRRQKLIALAEYVALKTRRTRPKESAAAHELAEALKLDRV